MKKFKKIMASVLAIVMIISISIPAMAAREDLDSDNAVYTIKIDDGVAGQTYSAYKVFDVTLADATGNDADTGFAYSISNSSAFWDVVIKDKNGTALTADGSGVYTNNDYGFSLTPSAGDATIYVVDVLGGASSARSADFAKALAADTTKPTAAATIASYAATTADTMNVTASGLGYYFVTTSTGALCSLDTTNQDVTIHEKNSLPTLAKVVKEDTAAETAYAATASGDINQNFNFKLTVNTGNDTEGAAQSLGTGNDKDFVITDTLPAGMSYEGNTWAIGGGSVTTGTTPDSTVAIEGWTIGTDFFVTYASDVLTITLKSSKVKTIGLNTDIAITYTAKLDDDCVIAGTGNTNSAVLAYGTYNTAAATATVYTYACALKKYNATSPLAGATFEYPLTATSVSAGDASNPAVYKISDATTGTTSITTPASGVIILLGLDDDRIFNVTETAAPNGYKRLVETKSISVKAASTDTAEEDFTDTTADFAVADAGGYQIHADSIIGVLNTTGSELPATGGMGTTIFYGVGGTMMAVAVILLIIKKRKAFLEG